MLGCQKATLNSRAMGKTCSCGYAGLQGLYTLCKSARADVHQINIPCRTRAKGGGDCGGNVQHHCGCGGSSCSFMCLAQALQPRATGCLGPQVMHMSSRRRHGRSRRHINCAQGARERHGAGEHASLVVLTARGLDSTHNCMAIFS